MDNNQKLLDFLSTRGPSLPVHIAKFFGVDTMMASVMTSYLVEKKQIKISFLKIGSSQLYYLPGQEAMLINFSKHLNEKDLRTFALLNEKKVLRDSKQTPLIRVSLRNIKDFAVPLEVTINNKKEVFWKWFLTSSSECEHAIKLVLGLIKPERKAEPQKQVQKPMLREKPQPIKVPVHNEDRSVQGKSPIENENKTIREETSKPDIVKKEIIKEKIKQPEVKEIKQTEKPKRESRPSKEKSKEEIQKRMDDEEIETSISKIISSNKFAQNIKEFFDNKHIKILNIEVIKKASEIDLEVTIPTPIGNIYFYCKAKRKTRINEQELSYAMLQGQNKKLPTIFASTGNLTKKAKEFIEKDLKGMVFIKI